MDNLTLTFPFSLPTLVTAVVAYLAVTPLVTDKLKPTWHSLLIGVLIGLFSGVFTLGYGLRFALGVCIMETSRKRLNQTGWLKEVSMLVITLVVAILFVGLR